MSLKYLLPALLLVSSLSANAAFMSCQFQDQACDQYDNHYLCKLIGWTGSFPPTHCSPTDESTGPGRAHGRKADCMRSCLASDDQQFHNNRVACEAHCPGF